MTIALKITKSQASQLAKNLRALLVEHQVSENNIAQTLNIPVMTVRRLVSGETADPRISTLKLFADYFKISVDSLIEDRSSKSINTTGKNIPQFIPILDWGTAAKITSIQELDLKSWKEWHPVILGDQSSLSENAFALISKPSMQPRFPLGTLFIIDSNETPIDGDIVLIQMKKDSGLSLRELIVDPPKWQLLPVTPGSEILFYDKKQHRIVGVVILIMLHSRKDK
jgi:SOS-response transcriptional repressor LexA